MALAPKRARADWRAEPRRTCAMPKFGSSVALTLGANVLIAAAGLATGAAVARMLGPEGRGELAAIQLWPTFLATVGMLGMPEALVYFSARDPARASRETASAVALGLAGCIVLMITGYFAMPMLLSSQDLTTVAASRWYLLIGVGYALAAIPQTVLRGTGDFAWWNGLRFVSTAVWAAAIGAAWWSGRMTAEYLAAANLVLMLALGIPATALGVLRRIAGPFVPDVSMWRPMLRFGVPSALTSVPYTLNLRLDQMLMAALLPAAMLGLYAVAVVWSMALSPLFSAVAVVFFPHVASVPERRAQVRSFVAVARLACGLTVAAGLGGAAVTPWMLPAIFGEAFEPALDAAIILMFGSALLGLNQVLEEGLRGLGAPSAVLWSELGGLAVTALVLPPLLRSYDIVGAAIASLIGYAAVAALLLICARRVSGCTVIDMLVPSATELRIAWQRIRASA